MSAEGQASPHTVTLRRTVAPKRGLLDTPLRLAFGKTGALAFGI